MAKFALWWIRWNEDLRTYESRMKVGGRKATVNDFQERGFDRVVVLDGEGRNSHCSGSLYSNGYNDGRELAEWILTRDIDMPLYITIPFYRPDGKQRDQTQASFSSVPDSYYRGWIDGVLSVDVNKMMGFYWSYESSLQTGPHGENVSKEFIQGLYSYVHGYGQELIWIPSTGGGTSDRGVSYLNDPNYDGILNIGGYFDYIFVQPNYYQYQKLDEKGNPGLPYTYEKLVEKIRWVHEELPRDINNPNTTISIEMEVDRTVLGIHCTYPSACPEGMNCDSNIYTCYEHCREHQSQKAINYALDYVRALNDAGWKPSDLAYYFSTDFKVIDILQEKCWRELNEPYV
ncbi:hypothetical protein A3L11_06235 [Thermococcus siculi]|uniref:DUF4855 domain-containing protein n=1 Tax=Thermococcus siculi TaxID=72803 RepID=A0A2Z2MKC3_9EURY|nr:DUF4855 domain-containing protein [Thermococcus siculi]ASJ08842.1 hypothetical protein A3L11_06235 [Thermococcus siculi]